MSQTISVSTTMGEQGFRDFAVFDAFHHRKAWLRPAVFAAIMLAFAAVCLSQLGKRPGAGLLAAVLAIVGIGLPVSYFYSFFRSVSRQINCVCRLIASRWRHSSRSSGESGRWLLPFGKMPRQ